MIMCLLGDSVSFDICIPSFLLCSFGLIAHKVSNGIVIDLIERIKLTLYWHEICTGYAKGSPMLTYDISSRKGLPKYEYLYRCIRADIRSGTIKPKTKLPAKRILARHLSLSVSTIEAAYNLLVEQGYVNARQGSGFYVAEQSSSLSVRSASQTQDGFAGIRKIPEIPAAEPAQNAVQNGHPVEQQTSSPSHEVDFSANRCSMNLFPADTWARIMRSVLSDRNPELFETVPYNGLLAARQAIASYLYEFKGFKADPEQIVIGAGTEYLYGRLLQLFGPRCVVAAGDAGSKKLVDISRSMGIAWDFIPVDEQGLCTDRLYNSTATVVHASPANHFPTGIVMSDKRRQTLLTWLHEKEHRYLIEDDYDSELRYEGTPAPTLFSQDEYEKTIYLNTLSKTLVPSLRISYMVLPPSLASLYQQQLSFYSCTVSSFEQLALASFLSGGYFERHINRLVRYYGEARQNLFSLLDKSPLMTIAVRRPVPVGTHLVLHIATARSDEEIRVAAHKQGLRLSMLSDYCVTPTVFNIHELVLNFASVEVKHMPRVVTILEQIFAEEIASAADCYPTMQGNSQ